MYLPSVPLKRLDKLGGSIIIWDIEPEAMRNSSGDTLTQTERVSADEVSSLTVWVIQSVEEKWGGWTQQVLYVLLQCINFFARWVFSNLQIQ